MQAIEILQEYYGHNNFRAGQEEIIHSILNEESVLAVLPTGAGKSVCFQIPSIMAENFSIVISPLIALMKDQVDSLNTNKEIAAFINSTMNSHETEAVLQNIQFGKIKLLYLSPEKLGNTQLAERLKKLSPKYLFVDEAHCISEWGHNFRPSYTKIRDFIEYINISNVSAFTATATPEVVEDIIIQLGLKDPKIFVRGFERENIHISVILTRLKKERTLELLRQFGKPAIIYTSSRKRAEEVSEYLVLNGINCEYYHAGLPPEIRRRIQDDFSGDRLQVIAATNAFGMGIDKRDIRLIVHFNTPGTIENYYQEIGRAGRDGKDSYAFLLHDDSDINIHNYFLSISYPTKEIIHKIYDAICDYAQIPLGEVSDKEISVNTDYIKNHSGTDITPGLIHSSLKYLEESEYISTSSDYISDSSIIITASAQKFQNFLKKTSNELIKDLSIFMLRKFGNEIFGKRIKFSVLKLASESGFSVEEIGEALTLLDNSAFAEYTQFDSKDLVRLTQPRLKAENLRLNYKRINEYYLNGQKKLNKIIDYVYSDNCRFSFILKYFGENTDNYSCDKCDNCGNRKTFPSATLEYVKEVIMQTYQEAGAVISEQNLIGFLRGKNQIAEMPGLVNFSTLINYPQKDIKSALASLVNEGKLIKAEGRQRGYISGKTESEKELFVQEKDKIKFDDQLELFHKLRELRAKISKRFLQTPELICPDRILAEISRTKPKSKSELMKIKGFTQRMFNKIGLEILQEIEITNRSTIEGVVSKKLPQNIIDTYNLLIKGHTLKEIASLRKLDEAVISMQIETILQYEPETNIDNIISRSEQKIIFQEMESGYTDLKELRDRLENKISYPILRIAAAKKKSSKIPGARS